MKYISLLFVVLLFSCGRKYYLSADISLADTTSRKKIQVLQLDTSYHFYRREVYKDTNSAGLKTLQSSVKGKPGENLMPIEVEYMLISAQHGNVIYISTIPDKFQKRYIHSSRDKTFLNAYFFNTFHLGAIVKNTAHTQQVLFSSKKEKNAYSDEWEIDYNQDSVTIRSILKRQNGIFDQYILVNEALEQPLSFKKMDAYQIVHYYLTEGEANRTFLGKLLQKVKKLFRKKATNLANDKERHLVNNQMTFVTTSRHKKKKYRIYFKWDAPLRGKNERSTIFFNDARIHYQPDFLFIKK